MSVPAPSRTRQWVTAVAGSAVIVAYGNVATLAGWYPAATLVIPGPAHPAMLAAALAWALGPARLAWADLGLTREGWRRSALLGLALGGGMTLLVVAPILLARAIGWGSATAYPQADEGGGIVLVALRLLIAVALCEEFWFRGVIQASWVRLLGVGRGIVVQAALFAAWHVAVWWWTLGRVSLTPEFPLVLTFPAGMLILFAAGLLFGWLRHAGRHLAGPVVAHWVIDVALVSLVWAGWL
jgi:membrane protease YdiL (CAAX protease family)